MCLGGRVMAATGLTPAEPAALNPTGLSLTHTARALSAAENGKVTAEMLQANVDAGAPTKADGTLNLVHYAAWLNQGQTRGDRSNPVDARRVVDGREGGGLRVGNFAVDG